MAGYGLPGAQGQGAEVSPRRRAGFLIHPLAVLIAAELMFVFASVSQVEWPAFLGLILDIFLVVSLPVQASLVYVKDRPLATFLGALLLAPLLRVVTLTIPPTSFSTVGWLAVVSVPLLLAAGAVMFAQRLSPRDVFLAPGARRYLPLNVALLIAGFGIGLVEFQVLRPDPWIDAPGSPELPFAIVAVFLATGLAEELIFRGILLSRAVPLLGRRGALMYTTAVFAALHIGYVSVPEFLVAFLLGLVFGIVVLLTRTIWGAAGSHGVANVLLYLVLPYGLL